MTEDETGWQAAVVNPEIVKGVNYGRCDHCHEKTSVASVKAPSAYSLNYETFRGVPHATDMA